ncbi:hypothetical protein CBM2609_B30151 [Cupriavidus taiwanensis]|uniref:Uncharacterized protein n=1 Tax=Cupriavidus taiwanensis TaxID=164546 RepID=A0A375EEM6_9BURK|nr:hypothetical protein CBM2604_B40149 [Cupriavidus taiwanensis]SOZ32459.1 hypothetical protein CBM2609_B30151 [Cupriavidus taiwanensis]SOZ48050.1 hypothetical protein CBM2610_B30149 [Cupriavidus taiwanensis]SOZ73087.1 hypothetical protein CBM2613_B50229 [Cupriavidus taiwanensis]SPA02933.1 hypothetical protein CBM2626_B50133 [Cupriavidus taiwanensis]
MKPAVASPSACSEYADTTSTTPASVPNPASSRVRIDRLLKTLMITPLTVQEDVCASVVMVLTLLHARLRHATARPFLPVDTVCGIARAHGPGWHPCSLLRG